MKKQAARVRQNPNAASSQKTMDKGPRLTGEHDLSPPTPFDLNKPRTLSTIPLTPGNVLYLQRTIGNQAVKKLIQAKYRARRYRHLDEQEAGQVAESIAASEVDKPVQRMTPQAESVHQVIQAKPVQQRANQNTIQRIGPAAGAAMGAAEWIGLGAAGYAVAQDAVGGTAGDVSYTFDEMEGVLLPGGGNDVPAYRTAHPNAQIQTHTHIIRAWQGTSGSKKMGVKFGLTFNYDGHAIGNISCRIIDTYDWPMWEGSINVNFTPLSLANGDVSQIRITINGNADRTFAGGRAQSRVLILDATGLIRTVEGELYVRFGNG